MTMYNPPHPGSVLFEEYISAYKFSISAFALRIGTSRKNLSEIINGKTGISAEMALKLSKALGTSAQLWLNMQQAYDLWQARKKVNLDDIEPLAL